MTQLITFTEKQFSDMVAELQSFQIGLNSQIQEPAKALVDKFKKQGFSPELAGEAKELRKQIVSTRTTVEKLRKSHKAPFLEAGRVIDKEAKVINTVCQDAEDSLKEVELYMENQIKAKKASIREDRVSALRAVGVEEVNVPVEDLSDVEWVSYLRSQQDQAEANQKEAARKEEQDALELLWTSGKLQKWFYGFYAAGKQSKAESDFYPLTKKFAETNKLPL